LQIACGIIGFRVAGRGFGCTLSDTGCIVSACDLQQNNVPRHAEFTAVAIDANVTLANTAWEAVLNMLGQANTINMLRPVVVKGLVTLLAEVTLGAERAGVTDELFSSSSHTYPGTDWPKEASYHMCRMALHGKRRAAKSPASARTLIALGVDPFTAIAIAQRQQWSVDLNLKETASDKDSLTIAEYAAAVEGYEQHYKEEAKNDT